jgi:adenine-specific DNA-methyltransferase
MSNLYSNEIEKSYVSNTNLDARKKFAQFFTPFEIAKFMAKWVIGGDRKIETILDPAVGLGVFPRAIASVSSANLKVKGYDIDPSILSFARPNLADLPDNLDVSLICKDYMFNDWNNRYDGIICNPPYFKFQDFDSKDEALQEFQYRLGMNLSGFTNIYALFLLKSITQLKPDGRCAYIIPSEFLNSDYGKLVKDYLIKLKSLRYVVVFDFESQVFDDALTTSSIFLFSNDRSINGVEFITISSGDELSKIAEQLSFYPNVSIPGKFIDYEHLDASIKWRNYYQASYSGTFTNLVEFKKYAKVSRGIATGANDYFLFSQEKADKFKIPNKYLEPLVCKANQVIGHFFTNNDFDKLVKSNRDAFLFNALDLNCREVRDYIKLGEAMDVHKKHLTSHRNPWYAVENRLPAPIWVSVFSRGGLKFIRNESGIRNLTTFHCVYPNMQTMDKIDLLFAYLLTPTSKKIFSDNRREYGGGLEKFEPNDLNFSKVIDLDSIDANSEKEILSRYFQFRETEIIGSPDVSIIEEIDNLFLKKIQPD